jgi:hypothetical protein
VIGGIVEFGDLKRLSGFERRADVERWAKSVGLPVMPCKGGVWTTLDALNHTLGVRNVGGDGDPYSAEVI